MQLNPLNQSWNKTRKYVSSASRSLWGGSCTFLVLFHPNNLPVSTPKGKYFSHSAIVATVTGLWTAAHIAPCAPPPFGMSLGRLPWRRATGDTAQHGSAFCFHWWNSSSTLLLQNSRLTLKCFYSSLLDYIF